MSSTETSSRPAKVLLLFAFALLVYLRAPGVFHDPHLYAEEATTYFLFAWDHSFVESVFTPHLGYYSLIPNLATALAAHAVPLEGAPFITLGFGFSFVLFVAGLVVLPGSPFATWRWQGLALLLILLVPPGYGRLHTTFTHFYCCLATGVVLISSSGGRFADWTRRAALLVCGLTGVLSIFLAPLFAVKWWRERDRETLIQTGIIGGCALLQVGMYFTTSADDAAAAGERFGALAPGVAMAICLNQTWIHLFGGRYTMGDSGEWLRGRLGEEGGSLLLTLGLFVALLVCVVVTFVSRRREHSFRLALLALAYLLVVGLSIVSGTTGWQGSRLALLDGHQRYFYAPNVFVALALLLQLAHAAPRWREWFHRLVLLCLLAVGVVSYRAQAPEIFLEGPSWRTQVQLWRNQPRRPIQIWPENAWAPLPLRPKR